MYGTILCIWLSVIIGTRLYRLSLLRSLVRVVSQAGIISYIASKKGTVMFGRSKDIWAILSFVGILLLGAHSSLAWCDDTQKKKPLYDRLGGLATISVVISDFIDIVEHDVVFNANPIVGDVMKGVSAPYLKYQMTAFMCQAAGGPCLYPGRDMKESHAHLGIKELEWGRMTALFREVLITNHVPEKERQELLKIINSVKADIVDHSQE